MWLFNDLVQSEDVMDLGVIVSDGPNNVSVNQVSVTLLLFINSLYYHHAMQQSMYFRLLEN